MSDDILDSLDDDEEESTRPDSKRDNAAFAQMRKELKAAQKKAEEAEAALSEVRSQARKTTFKDAASALGLNPRLVSLYPADAEVSPEAVRSWAISEEFIQAEEGEEQPPPDKGPGFTPTVITEADVPGSKMYSHEEFMELLSKDSNKAMQIHKAGRVALNKSPETYFVGRDR